MGNSLSIWASIAVEALACSGRLLPVVHPTRPARINAPAAMAAKLVLRICSLLRLVRTYDRVLQVLSIRLMSAAIDFVSCVSGVLINAGQSLIHRFLVPKPMNKSCRVQLDGSAE